MENEDGTAAPTKKQALRDFKGLESGKHDGVLFIENEKPKMTGPMVEAKKGFRRVVQRLRRIQRHRTRRNQRIVSGEQFAVSSGRGNCSLLTANCSLIKNPKIQPKFIEFKPF
jgi:hypothetical protein